MKFPYTTHKDKIVNVMAGKSCQYCGEEFSSRNKLFDHLRSKGVLGIKEPLSFLEIRKKRLEYKKKRRVNKMIKKMMRLRL